MNLAIELPGLSLKNPIMPASGCFGFGREYSEFYNLSKLGAVIMKAATGSERFGNPTPRVAETASGMLNAIGLQNPGVHKIIETEVPFLSQFDTNIIANIAGSTLREYEEVAYAFNEADKVHALELKISCPVVKEPAIQYGTATSKPAHRTQAQTIGTHLTVYVNRSSNETDFVSMAKAVESAGADGLSMIYTIPGMQIHVPSRKPLIA